MIGMTTNQHLGTENEKKRRRRTWLILILLLLLTPVCLGLASRIALFNLAPDEVDDSMLSRLKADYGRWDARLINPVNPVAIETIRADQLTNAASGDSPLGDPVSIVTLEIGQTLIAEANTPTATMTVPRPDTPTPTQTIPPAASPTPAATATTAPTSSPVPVPTDTPAPLPTNTPVSPPTDTPIPPPTGTSIPPSTDTPVPPPTDTPTPIPTPVRSVQFQAAGYTTAEDSVTVTLTVTLNAAAGEIVQVNYATADGSAAAPGDYSAASGVVTFTPGQVSQPVVITINDDLLDEPDETFSVTLSGPVNAVLGAPSTAVVTIQDNDLMPTVEFYLVDYTVNEADPAVYLAVALSQPSGYNVSVDYTTVDGTAVSPGDYTGTSGTVNFPPGSGSQPLLIALTDDGVTEPNEDFQAQLSTPVNANLGAQTTATTTIIDDDGVGTCVGFLPAGEPDIGPPDGVVAEPNCGTDLIVDMGAQPITADGDAGVEDMVFFEFKIDNPTPPPLQQIYLDWIIVQLGTSPAGPWYTVFYWGDGIVDTNTNVGLLYGLPETDNRVLAGDPLYQEAGYFSGITIDVDARVPPGIYQYVRFFSPNSTDASQIDALHSLP